MPAAPAPVRHSAPLLADEVGLGKIVSLTAALTLCLLSDKENGPRRPVVIRPSHADRAMADRDAGLLGILTARWDTVARLADAEERVLSPGGREQPHCPPRIGIVPLD